MGSIGAGIIGRPMFDVIGGWGGNPPGGPDARYFVVTHSVPQECLDSAANRGPGPHSGVNQQVSCVWGTENRQNS